MRFALISLCLISCPAAAQEEATGSGVERATSEVSAHRINLRVGCPVPMPALWNAPPWEQRAAAERRYAFEGCLSNAMVREQERLEQLERRVAALQAHDPHADWSSAEEALDGKWSELEALAGKLRTRQSRADTAIRILDTFTGPGAPFDTTPRSSYNRCAPYRCDTSTFAPGVR